MTRTAKDSISIYKFQSILITLKFKFTIKKIARQIEGLYYITHIKNVSSILEKGILSHAEIKKQKLQPEVIYNASVMNRREIIRIDEKSLFEFANLYFQPRNAMLYSLQNNYQNLAIICIKSGILRRKNIYLSDGNAASNESKILPIDQAKKYLPKIKAQVDHDWWNSNDGSKRKLMAECLVPQKVAASYIQSIYVSTQNSRENLYKQLKTNTKIENHTIPIIVEPKRFFLPDNTRTIAKNLVLVCGDMFFFKYQTLTISVNCVEIMGKGLASTAKYRFPDMYVYYQDLCKKKSIKIGKPYLYKRETSIFQELRDENLVDHQNSNNSQTWFLLFPTKDHWRNQSKLEEIEAGLIWVIENYKKLSIESLSLPALGCGLGGLSWELVGPLMCKYLIKMDIKCAIYLPTEKDIPEEWKNRNFLLSGDCK